MKIGDLWVHLGLKKQGFDAGLNDAKTKSSRTASSIVADFRKIAVQVGAVVAAIRGFASAFKVIADFERANSTLAAVLGTTREGVEKLAQSARDLGKSTEYTASEVTGLQTELARLGFSADQITGMQEGILKFAAAVGTDLSSAAARAGATMRGFGLTTSETVEMLSVMAVSTSKSALSFGYLDSSLGKFVPTAKAAGLDLKDSVALLGALANRGIDASSASTGLRTVLLSMGTASGKAAKMLGKPVTSLDELLDGMRKLKDSGADFSSVFGKYAYSVALALADAADSAQNLRGELDNTAGALDEMYGTRTDNVKGAIDRLTSAWQEFILTLSGSKGIIKGIVDELTNLVGIMSTITGGKSFKSAKIEDRITDTVKANADKTDEQFTAVINQKKSLRSLAGTKKRKKELDEEIYILEQAQLKLQKMRKEVATSISSVGGTSDEGEPDPLGDLLNKIKGKNTDPKLDEIKDDNEAIAADIELWEQAGAVYDEMTRKITGDNAVMSRSQQEWRDFVDEALGDAAHAWNDYEQELKDVADMEAYLSLENQQFIEQFMKDLEDAKDVAAELTSALVDGLAAGLQQMNDQIFGLEDENVGKIFQSLLEPLADMAINEGKLAVATGLGIEAIKDSLKSLNPVAAVAAGAALIALGTAAKSGLAAIAQGNSSTGTTSSASSSASSQSSTATKYEDVNINVKIEGKLKGSDIVLAARQTSANWNK